MGKKTEITPEQIELYVQFQKSRLKEKEREAAKVKSHIDRIQYKIDNAEKELRKDLAEGISSVSKATGIPLKVKAKAESDQVPAPAPAPAPGTKEEKKKSWEDF